MEQDFESRDRENKSVIEDPYDEVIKTIDCHDSFLEDDVITDKKDEAKVFLFVSFDLCNSTRLKTREEAWFNIIGILLKKQFQAMHLWKFNGDEVIFCAEVNSLDYICGIIEKAYFHLQTLRTEMNNISSKEDICLKSTIWIAKTHLNECSLANNCKFDLNGNVEFVGSNIDEGFRLTKCSSNQKVVIDPKIIYLFLNAIFYYKNSSESKWIINPFYKSICENQEVSMKIISKIGDVLDKIHYMGSVVCKGVWEERPYPIYWYFNKNTYGINYNEFFNGVHIWNKDFITLDAEKDYYRIKEIFNIVGKSDEYYEIRDSLQLKGTITQTIENRPNLYYMVACVNPETGKVMIARRSNNRTHLKHVWDFGNVKYQNVNVISTICQEYKNTFGIDIELITDPIRKSIKTFGYCTIYRNRRPHNSLLCYAIIKGNYSDEELIRKIDNHFKETDNYRMYDKVQFISDKEITYQPLKIEEIREDSNLGDAPSKLGENRCIMYFEDSIKNAIVECAKYGEQRKVYS